MAVGVVAAQFLFKILDNFNSDFVNTVVVIAKFREVPFRLKTDRKAFFV